MHRTCGKCYMTFPIENFYLLKSPKAGKPDGRSIYCKDCWKIINAQNKLKRKLRGH